MTHPDDDTLAALALGEPAQHGAAEHVRTCPSCSAAVRALGTSAAALREGAPELVAPPSSVWAAVEAELDAEPGETPEPARARRSPSPEASRLSVTEPASPRGPDDLTRQRASRAGRTGRGAVPRAWVAGAAAAGLVVGAVGTLLLTDDRPTSPVVVASTTLDTLDTQRAQGTADVVRQAGQLDLDLETGSLDPGGGYLEVWLINRDLRRMVSVGVLRPEEGHQRFAIDQALLDQGYVIVDISREGFDDRPEHSGDSIVRGTLAL